jgi:Uma2 family endonuclease
MTLAVPPSPARAPAPADEPYVEQRVLLEGISWTTYERLLRELNDRPIHLTYDDGLLEIFVPGPPHENVKKVVARLIEAYGDETGIDVQGLGSMTMKSRRKKKGLEPDECYYVGDIGRALALGEAFDAEKNPPPDLAIEVDVTSDSIPREPIYAALRVPEIWRHDGERIGVLLRQPDGTYAPAPASAAFPAFPMEQVNQFLAVGLAEGQSAAVRALRAWVRSARQPG